MRVDQLAHLVRVGAGAGVGVRVRASTSWRTILKAACVMQTVETASHVVAALSSG